jgi:hypothetical protein
MLARPEIATREHVLMWLAAKDANERFEWLSGDCPAGQYAREFGIPNTCELMNWLNNMAQTWPHTWGALAERAGFRLA